MAMDYDARSVLARGTGGTKAAGGAASVTGGASVGRAGGRAEGGTDGRTGGRAGVPGIMPRDGAANPDRAIKTASTIPQSRQKVFAILRNARAPQLQSFLAWEKGSPAN